MTANPSFICGGPAALALAWALAFAAPASAEVAGKVLFVAGNVTLERTPPVAIKAGDLIETGAVIATGEKSRAQILMNDGARVALRASSRYRVDDFSLPAAVGAPIQVATTRAEGVSVATLLKGGFRSSTGAIGKDGAGTYEVRTPIGTLGIRGTDYTAVWCQGDCGDAPGISAANAARNGMYLATHAGAIVFRYGGREAVVNAGQVIFIAAADALPEPLEELPVWVIGDGAGRLETGAQENPVKGGVTSSDLADRGPPPTGQQPPPQSPAADPKDPSGQQGVQRPVIGTANGQTIDLTSGQLPRGPNDPPPGTPSLPPPSSNVPPPPPPGGN